MTCTVESLKDGLNYTGSVNRLRFDMEAAPIYAGVNLCDRPGRGAATTRGARLGSGGRGGVCWREHMLAWSQLNAMSENLCILLYTS